MVARIVRDCRDIPGLELFLWIDERGERRRIDSNDVNDYLREASGGAFTAKDFRTWFATLEAIQLLRTRVATTERETRKHIVEITNAVAAKLGNTPTICRKCYIHPEVFAAFSAGKLAALKRTAAPQLVRALLAPTRKSASSEQSYPQHQHRNPQESVRADGAARRRRLKYHPRVFSREGRLCQRAMDSGMD
jgi:DNA topoisomerase-1